MVISGWCVITLTSATGLNYPSLESFGNIFARQLPLVHRRLVLAFRILTRKCEGYEHELDIKALELCPGISY